MNLRFTLITLCTLGVLLSGACSCNAAQAGFFYFRGVLPPSAVSFDDLDVRDTNNRPVASANAQDELRSVFQSSLYTLLVNAETYSLAEALSIIGKKLNLAAHALLPLLPKRVGNVLSACLFPTRKLPFILAVVFSLLSVRALFPVLSQSGARMALSPLEMAPPVLRC